MNILKKPIPKYPITFNKNTFFMSCKKVFLGSLKFSSEERLRVIYRNEDIEKVDIIGSVVSLLQKEKYLIFKYKEAL
ncbi:hypothetical protein Avbf_12776 [Armadillidium vulgare]|nr:hypothetical protein Avbf_12776 [Armadillidium vulgare]